MTTVPPEDSTVRDRRGKTWTVAQLRERVSVVEPAIIRLAEIPDSNAECFTVLARIAGELGRPFDTYVVIIDLAEATARPDPAMMKAIMDSADLLGACTVTVKPASTVIRAILRFVTNRAVGRGDHVGADTYPEALELARKKLKEHQR